MSLYSQNKELYFIRNAFNSGITLSKAYKFMLNYGFTNKVFLISEWRLYRRTFKGGSLPQSAFYFEDLNKKLQPSVPTHAELNSVVGAGGMTYGEWKGITGKGKLLKEILNLEKQE